MQRSRHTYVLGVLCSAVFTVSAYAQANAVLTLSSDAVFWDEPVVAHIEGHGCRGEIITGPTINETGTGNFTIDIDVADCDGNLNRSFVLDVPIEPLFPNSYTVRVHDSIRRTFIPGWPPMDTARLNVHRRATLDVEIPEAPTNALTGTTLVFRAPASTSCAQFSPPTVRGNIISATFVDNCPVLPIGGPGTVEQDHVLDLEPGDYEVRFFDATDEIVPLMHRERFTVYDKDRCVPSDTTLCIADNRFRVDVQWTDFQSRTGAGHAVPLEGRGDSGLFWFFGPENVELTVKLLDGCALNNRRWVFLSSGTTVGFTMTVTDTETGAVKTYSNAVGQSAPLTSDTNAFACNGGS
jgi:hypothetical protein